MKGLKMNDLKKLELPELKKKLEDLESALLIEKRSTKTRAVKKAISRLKLLISKKEVK
ncbi:MAG: hypothetical protein WC501_01790 [Candidatus Micrarchaeia archaeon]